MQGGWRLTGVFKPIHKSPHSEHNGEPLEKGQSGLLEILLEAAVGAQGPVTIQPCPIQVHSSLFAAVFQKMEDDGMVTTCSYSKHLRENSKYP